MPLAWKRIRSGEWVGREGDLTYTIRQSGGTKFYVTRTRSSAHPFATQRSLTLAKKMAEEDARERAGTRRGSSEPIDRAPNPQQVRFAAVRWPFKRVRRRSASLPGSEERWVLACK